MSDNRPVQVSPDFDETFAFHEAVQLAAKASPHDVATPSVQTQYSKEAALRAEAKAASDHAAQAAFKAFCTEHPEASVLNMRPSNLVFKKQPTKHRVVIPAILDRLSGSGGASKSQVAISNSVATSHGVNVSKNVWRTPLPARTIKRFQEKLPSTAIHNLKVDLSGCKNLADIKRRIEAASDAQSSVQSVEVQLQFTPSALVIGNVSYPLIDRSGAKAYKIRYEGKAFWLNVDALRFLINKSAASA